jgi:hypothetical protein
MDPFLIFKNVLVRRALRAVALLIFFLYIQGVAMGASIGAGPEKPPPANPNSEEKVVEEAPAVEPPVEEGKVAGEAEKKPEVTVTEKEPEEKKEKKKEKWTKVEGAEFAYTKLTLAQGGYTFVTHGEGEMINNTGIDYSIVKFLFSVYDSRGRLITEEAFHILDFPNGQQKPFRATLVDGYREIASFKIRFRSAVAAAR